MHASAVVGDKIYMIGGSTGYSAGTQTVKVYDIPSNTWSLLPSSANFPHVAYYFDAIGYSGDIYLTGGSTSGMNDGPTQFNYYYKFKPATNTWERLPDLPTGQGQHTLVELDAKIYSIGGTNGGVARNYVYMNVLANGGVVASNQSFCPENAPYDPSAFTSVSGASGGLNSFTYQWEKSSDRTTWTSISGETNLTYDVPSSAAVSQTTYYRRKAVDSSSLVVYSNTITVELAAPPAITVQPTITTQSICTGGTATALSVTATGTALTYQWYENATSTNTGGSAISGATLPSYTPLTNVVGTKYYYVIVSGACNPSVTSAVSGAITTTNAISSGTISANQQVCSGSAPSPITLTGHVGNIQWQISTNNSTWTNITGATAATLTSAQAGNLTATRFFRAVISGNGCSSINSSSVQVAVSTAPVITSQPLATVSVCQNANYTLAATVTGSSLSYQWFSNTTNSNTGGTSMGSSRNAQTVALTPDTSTPGTYYYYLVVTSGACSVTSAVSVITVLPQPVVGTASASSLALCAGETTTLSLAGSTGTIQWQSSPNNSSWTDISGANAATFTTPVLSAATTYYRAQVTSASCAAVTSNVLTVSVTPFPTIPGGALSFDGSNDYVSTGTGSTLNFSGSNANFAIEAWVYFTGGSSIKTIFGKKFPGGGTNGYSFYIN